MKLVITGGAGFIGRMLAQAILARGSLTGPSGRAETVDELVLFDASAGAPLPPALARAKLVLGDIAERAAIDALIDRPDISVFHLASIVSAGAEQDFDLALRVNLDGARHLLEACRRLGSRPRLVFTSSVAVFGPPAMGETVDDLSKETPQTTYGMTKAVGELLVNDYSRKGFVDGRAARLPTIVVRPIPRSNASLRAGRAAPARPRPGPSVSRGIRTSIPSYGNISRIFLINSLPAAAPAGVSSGRRHFRPVGAASP